MGVVYFFLGREFSCLYVEANLLVSIAERHTFASQTVDLFDGEHEVVAGIIENVLVDFEPGDDVGRHLEALAQFLESRQEDFLDDLQVTEVTAGQVVHDECYLLWQSLQLVTLGASQLEDIGVLLVGHDAGACGTLLWQLNEPEVLTVVETGIEGKLTDGSSDTSQSESNVPFRLATSHLCIDDVVVERVEAKQLCSHRAVQGER